MKNLAEQSYWDESYEKVELEPALDGDVVVRFLQKWIPPGQGRCLEVGCYPGRYLPYLCQLGYALSGIDLTSHVKERLPAWLKSLGCRVHEFYQGDFFQHRFDRPFDLVCSFGFIEHFIRWPEVVERHCDLVAPGGRLVITTPNFYGGVQRYLHARLDRANFDRHNIESMRPDLWLETVVPLGFEPVFSGYLGKFDFWTDDEERSLSQKLLIKLVKRLIPPGRLLPAGGRSYSPHCGLVAEKKSP